MSWAAAIPAGLGLVSSLFGKKKGKGKETEYAVQAPEYQQQFSKDFYDFLQGRIGQGATPYGGQVAAGADNPFTRSALGLWGASPYGQFGGGGGQQPQMSQGQMPQQASFLGGGGVPQGQQQMSPQGMMGQASRMMQMPPQQQQMSPQMSQFGGGMPRKRGMGVPFQR